MKGDTAMKREKIALIFAYAKAYEGKEITVCGWARTIRDMKNFGFISLNDGSCFKPLQVVFERETLENYDEIARQNVGGALICEGVLVLTPDAPQPFELKAKKICVEGVITQREVRRIANSCRRSSKHPAGR